jgi:hypothetical protein
VGSSCRRFREEGHAPVWWKPVKNLQAPPNENSSPVRGDSGCRRPIIAFCDCCHRQPITTRPCSVNRFIKPLVCRIVGQRFCQKSCSAMPPVIATTKASATASQGSLKRRPRAQSNETPRLSPRILVADDATHYITGTHNQRLSTRRR